VRGPLGKKQYRVLSRSGVAAPRDPQNEAWDDVGLPALLSSESLNPPLFITALLSRRKGAGMGTLFTRPSVSGLPVPLCASASASSRSESVRSRLALIDWRDCGRRLPAAASSAICPSSMMHV
jgi:hypothetical protein